MTIEIITRNPDTGLKRTVKTITDNRVVEHYLANEKGMLEHGTGKQLKRKDVYTLAGLAAIYLHNYREPTAKGRTGITDTNKQHYIEEMRTTKTHAQGALGLASYMLLLFQGSTQVAVRVK